MPIEFNLRHNFQSIVVERVSVERRKRIKTVVCARRSIRFYIRVDWA